MDGKLRVGIRSRPLSSNEVLNGSKECLRYISERNEIILGHDKTFTYDYVFGPKTSQESIYNKCAKSLLENVFHGYNATIFAYGQTGSGKTFTMGTSDSENCSPLNRGIIPRLMKDFFIEVDSRSSQCDFDINVSFLEIYNEVLNDLLTTSNSNDVLNIREEANNEIKIPGLSEVNVSSVDDVLECLARGSQRRTVGITAMNSSSSRSHAIFTLHLCMTCRGSYDVNRTQTVEKLNAKFHLVDLAGSERAKKTMTEGGRFREGININMGLLALGNVISALSEGRSHVPYRDSRITRLLRDSLGGNSHTLMLACVSPSHTSSEETLNTLRYAHRARQIKNKPVVNRAGNSLQVEVVKLRGHVAKLEAQLMNTTTPVISSALLGRTGQHREDWALAETPLKSRSVLEHLLDLTTSLVGEQHRHLVTLGLSNVSLESQYAEIVRELTLHAQNFPSMSTMIQCMSETKSQKAASTVYTGGKVTKRRRPVPSNSQSTCYSSTAPDSHSSSNKRARVASIEALTTPPTGSRRSSILIDSRTVLRSRQPAVNTSTIVRHHQPVPVIDSRTICKKRRTSPVVIDSRTVIRHPLKQITNGTSLTNSDISRELCFDEPYDKESVLLTSHGIHLPVVTTTPEVKRQNRLTATRRRSRASIRLAVKTLLVQRQQPAVDRGNRRTSFIPVSVPVTSVHQSQSVSQAGGHRGPRKSHVAKLNRFGIPSLFQTSIRRI